MRLLPAVASAWAAAFWATGAQVRVVPVLAVAATGTALGCGLASLRRAFSPRARRALAATALAAAAASPGSAALGRPVQATPCPAVTSRHDAGPSTTTGRSSS